MRTAGGKVSADWIVVATDAYSTAPWKELRSEQIHLPYFNFATEPLSSDLRSSILPERQGAWDTKEVLSSFRFDRAGRLVFGSVGALRGTGRPSIVRGRDARCRRCFRILAMSGSNPSGTD